MATIVVRLGILAVVSITSLATLYGLPKLVEFWLLSHLDCLAVAFAGDLLGCGVYAYYVGWRRALLLYWLLTTAELLLFENQLIACRNLLWEQDAVPAIVLATRAVRKVLAL